MMFNIINRYAGHLLTRKNEALDLSRIVAGRVEMDPEDYNLPQMLDDIGHRFKAHATDADPRF
ncbi:MAG: hypothetical protein P8103_05040 [Candidatus Thiodiazotropha sp.]|jgi:signal transduction histidine kinase